ncbi:MAG: hypothetical protein IJ408_04060 [Clostridia bacterium]|nr:hypothetical protein [Clostridia bacterium]
MKVTIIQPAYSTDFSKVDHYFEKQAELVKKCDDTMDIIVLPEAASIPCLAPTKADFEKTVDSYNSKLISLMKETALRCNAMVFANGSDKTDDGYTNVTYCMNRKGEIVGKYLKEHLTPGEVNKRKLKSDYTFEHTEPTVVEMEGIRFAFLTCYDFYFYENFANIARYNVDAIIGCSHQRSDTHRALEIMSAFLAYNTNAYVLRSSVSMDEKSDIGGGSMIVAPDGTVLASLESKVGLATAEIDFKKKYLKPAGFGGELSAHYEYIEAGRRPWKYRNAGSAIVKHDAIMPYPRICAHRGFNSVAPENSMPAWGAAIAMGAEEIEFDLWPTLDGEIVSCHDHVLDRVSDGEGVVYEKTYEELLKYDFGIKFGEKFKGMRIVKFEDILKKFAGHTVMNIHLKSRTSIPLPISYDEFVKKVSDLIHKYDCEKYCYFMTGDDRLLEACIRVAPHITRCCGAGPTDELKWTIVDRAIKYDCKKVQFFTKYFNQEMIDKAKANGIICNYFYCDDAEHAKQMLDMGIDTVLTNDYNLVSQVIKGEAK